MSVARQPVSRRLRVNGLVTHFLDAGDGEPLLLLHGGEFGAGAEVTWHRCIGELATDRHVVAADLFGFGRSDKVRDLVDQRTRIVGQIADLLDALCFESVDVVATSFSARLLVDVAATAADRWRLRRGVSIGLGLSPPSRTALAALGSFDGSAESMAATMDLLFHDDAVRQAELAARMELALLPGAWQSGRAAVIGRPANVAAIRPEPVDYGAIDRPLLLLRGEHDALVDPDDFAAFAAAIPTAQTAAVAAAGHYPQVERPAETAALITSFLAAGTSEDA